MKNCLICQQSKVDQRPPAGFMGHRILDRPWQTVAGDITGPFIRSKNGYEYILVFQDLFTRWVECIPLRKANGMVILKALKERIVLKFGTPEVFLTDNGTEFKNKLIDEYLKAAGIHHMLTPPYHPQANPVERVNRTLKTRIVAFVEENHKTWDEKLPELNFSLNTSPHASTGYTPALLNFARELTPPGTLRREQDKATAENLDKERESSWLAKMNRLQELQESARARNREQQRRQAGYYNARRRPSPYQVGDKVWKRNRVLSSSAQGVMAKLAPKYVGPYVIIEQCGSNTYKLADDNGEVEELIHAEHLKPFVQSAGVPAEMAEEEDDVAAGPSISQEVPRPPGELEATRDPPSERDASSADEAGGNPTQRARLPAGNLGERHPPPPKRGRGRPRKASRTVLRPATEDATAEGR